VKLVYAWAHLFAFKDRLAGRPLSWSPTGGAPGRASGRLRAVQAMLVVWPLLVVGLVVAGSVAHMSSPVDLDYWPPLVASGIYAAVAVAVLRPLPERDYVLSAAAAEAEPSRLLLSA
jgi:hypothetical protein